MRRPEMHMWGTSSKVLAFQVFFLPVLLRSELTFISTTNPREHHSLWRSHENGLSPTASVSMPSPSLSLQACRLSVVNVQLSVNDMQDEQCDLQMAMLLMFAGSSAYDGQTHTCRAILP